jgi:hypothetical protein
MSEQATTLTPCPHMKRALECMAQGKRGGIYLWYARLHTIKCARCRAVLEALKMYFSHLKSPVHSVDVDWDRLRNSWREMSGED